MIKIRVLSSLCYLGFAPQVRLLGFKKESGGLLEHHVNNGLTLSTVMVFSIIFCAVTLLAEYFIESQIPLDLIVVQIVFTISIIPTLIWALLTLFGVFQALRGVTASIPIVSQLSQVKRLKALSIFCGLLLQLLMLMPLRASYLVHSPRHPAAVYILYETTDYIQLSQERYWYYAVPKWLVATEFYPLTEFTVKRWGAGSVAIEALTEASLTKAFQEGKLVIVTAHGGDVPGTISYSVDSDEYYAPEDVAQNGGIGANLQFVYITGCNVGKQEDAWKKSLGNVDLVVFDRISFEQEHILWFALEGPRIVSELK